MYDFYEKNKSACISFIVVAVVCLCGAWLVHDYFRNEPIYNDTSSAMADLEKRIDGIESRVNSLSNRIADAEKTVNGISATINAGAGNAVTIKDGIDGIEKRIGEVVQRSGRIQNIIADIESQNK